MKKHLFLAGFAALLLGACQQQPEEKDPNRLSTSLVQNPFTAQGTDSASLSQMPVLVFADTVHHFGQIKEGENVSYDFRLRNEGKSPLVISTAEASCGCTVTSIPREPVPPGGESSLTIRFNSAGKPGHQEKAITVTSNASVGKQTLYIIAEVAPQ